MSFLSSILPSANDSANGSCATDSTSTVRPQYRVTETAEAFSVRVGLPGVAKDGVEVTAEAGEITIVGRRAWSKPEGWKALYAETVPANFELVLTHENDVDADRIQAELVDGILTVTVPKTEAAKPRKIQIS
jgi:HSP20 family protein